tara:strand:+ start:5750 stop:6331 length:582 start_codon:yes stop_codon:yes gene_type:complete
MKKEILVIGNGDSVLKLDAGLAIDSFDGPIVRLNRAITKGFESKVGTRTDVWATGGDTYYHFRLPELGAKTLLMVIPSIADAHKEWLWWRFNQDREPGQELINITKDEYSSLSEKGASLGPSTGLLSVGYYLNKGYRVHHYGFDHFLSVKVHYWHESPGTFTGFHHPHKEKEWFAKKESEGSLVKFDPIKNSI